MAERRSKRGLGGRVGRKRRDVKGLLLLFCAGKGLSEHVLYLKGTGIRADWRVFCGNNGLCSDVLLSKEGLKPLQQGMNGPSAPLIRGCKPHKRN